MCVACLLTVRPERGRTCLETGAYLLNYAACQGCQGRGAVISRQREEEEDEDDDGDYEQTISYTRPHGSHDTFSPLLPRRPLSPPPLPLSCADVCGLCGHEIASHWYTFSVTHPTLVPNAVLAPPPSSSTRVQHEYMMDCSLCGRASDTSHTVNDVVSHLDTHHRVLPHRPLPPSHQSVHLSAAVIAIHSRSHFHPPQGKADVEDAEWD